MERQNMKTIGVKIMPKKEVLDSQGRAVEKTLKHHHMDVNHCRVGKYIQLQIDANDDAEAIKKAEEIVDLVLYNPLVETYELEVCS